MKKYNDSTYRFSMKEDISDLPVLTQEDYREFYDAPCEKVKGSAQCWYGTGVVRKVHPLADKIPFDCCGDCESDDVLVVAAEWRQHPFTKEEEWEYEIFCEECAAYTQRYFTSED